MSEFIREKTEDKFNPSQKMKKTSIRHTGLIMLVIFAMFILMFSAGGCSAVETPLETEVSEASGADYFRQYYLQKAATDAEHDYSRMCLEKLEDMASETVGTVVDTEELTIEVAGAIISGCRAEVILRVTAKQLDSVLCDESVPKNARFGDESALFMRKYNFDSLIVRYYYSDENNSLAPNQFELHYSIIQEPFDQDHYTIELTNFGYYESGAKFIPLYTGSWTVDISFVPVSDTSRRIDIGQEIMVGDYQFILENMQISPLGCSVNLVCEEENAYDNEHSSEILEVFWDESSNCSLTLVDGTELGAREFNIGYSNQNDYSFFITFYGPMAVDDIASISLYETEFSLK